MERRTRGKERGEEKNRSFHLTKFLSGCQVSPQDFHEKTMQIDSSSEKMKRTKSLFRHFLSLNQIEFEIERNTD